MDISVGDFVQYAYTLPETNTRICGVGTVIGETVIGTDNGYVVQRPDNEVVYVREVSLLNKKRIFTDREAQEIYDAEHHLRRDYNGCQCI